jgi:DNA-binding CsgD family transcriptional regulator
MSEPSGPIRVVLCIGEPALRHRIATACTDLGIALAPDGELAERPAILLADRPVATAGPTIAIASTVPAWPCDLRAAVPPDIDAATLGAVIAVVAAGLAVVPRAALPFAEAPIRGGWADAPAAEDGDEAVLTPREREVLALLAAGASNKEIARALSVSVHTAKFHVASLTEKLGASGRAEAVAIGIRAGLIMV